jgi:succinate dehydrogenase / fumarate reductase cytochrome b subunit
MNTIFRKKIMALTGIFWAGYVVFHLFSLLNIHFGLVHFEAYFQGLKAISLYSLWAPVLLGALLFHAITAILRQRRNHQSKGQGYHKSYPKEVPRVVAWGGALTLLLFIIFHFVQMKLLNERDLFQQLVELFDNPVMWVVYMLGIVTLSAHLHHALSNVAQTLGISSKTYQRQVVLGVGLLFIGFISVLIRIAYV